MRLLMHRWWRVAKPGWLSELEVTSGVYWLSWRSSGMSATLEVSAVRLCLPAVSTHKSAAANANVVIDVLGPELRLSANFTFKVNDTWREECLSDETMVSAKTRGFDAVLTYIRREDDIVINADLVFASSLAWPSYTKVVQIEAHVGLRTAKDQQWPVESPPTHPIPTSLMTTVRSLRSSSTVQSYHRVISASRYGNPLRIKREKKNCVMSSPPKLSTILLDSILAMQRQIHRYKAYRDSGKTRPSSTQVMLVIRDPTSITQAVDMPAPNVAQMLSCEVSDYG